MTAPTSWSEPAAAGEVSCVVRSDVEVCADVVRRTEVLLAIVVLEIVVVGFADVVLGFADVLLGFAEVAVVRTDVALGFADVAVGFADAELGFDVLCAIGGLRRTDVGWTAVLPVGGAICSAPADGDRAVVRPEFGADAAIFGCAGAAAPDDRPAEELASDAGNPAVETAGEPAFWLPRSRPSVRKATRIAATATASAPATSAPIRRCCLGSVAGVADIRSTGSGAGGTGTATTSAVGPSSARARSCFATSCMGGRSTASGANIRTSRGVSWPLRRGGNDCPDATRCSSAIGFWSAPNGGEPSSAV